MKKIEAIVRHERLDKIKNALVVAGFSPMTLIEVMGRGEQQGVTLEYRGREVKVDLLPKVKIELVVDDDKVDKAIDAIVCGGWTGKPGDGKIFILPVERCLSLRAAKACTAKQNA